jgi:hypothetical protein
MNLVDLHFFTAVAILIILEYILDDCKMPVGMTLKMCWNCTEKLELQSLQQIVTTSLI